MALPEIKITKLDAALRQLQTAVRLYFSDADPVSIHTLTAAAHRILADLAKARGGTPMAADAFVQKVRADQREEAKRRLSAAANFFKHADRDSEDVHTFSPSQTEFMLVDACYKYGELTGGSEPMLGVYIGWFWLGPGAKFVDVSEERSIDQFRAAFHGETKSSFFAQALAMATRVKP
jgi:hypothetical protein